MADVDELARRAVATVSTLAQRGVTLATGVAGAVAVVVGLVYLLGLVVLDGSIRAAWTIVGGVLVVIAVGAPLLARWRLTAVRRDAGELVTEVRTLLQRNSAAERVVIETFEAPPPGSTAGRRPRPAVVVQTQQFTSLRQLVGTANDLRSLPGALSAVATFPALLAVAVLLTLVFVVLGVLFLIAWIF